MTSFSYRAINCLQQPAVLLSSRALLLFLRRSGLAFLISIFLFATPARCKAGGDGDEISVYVSLQHTGTHLPALMQERELYLPVKELFDFLKIHNRLSENMDSLEGAILDSKTGFLIDHVMQQIQYKGTSFSLLNKELIRTESNLFLHSDAFGKIFGIECNFQFRNLAVLVKTELDLPLLRELRQQVLRTNIRKIKGEQRADTTLKRDYPLLRLGTAEWNILHSSTQGQISATQINLQAGGMLAGGEASVSLNYENKNPSERSRNQYRWRYVNNSLRVLRQVSLGTLSTQSTASLYAPVVGLQVTNTATTRRKSFGTFIISDHTEPEWLVELYVNNVLVNYIKADASGFYSFSVPLVYGNSQVTLKFLGPLGEEHSSVKNIQIPFSFLPVREFEYVLTAGIVKDSTHSQFWRASFHYGLTKTITMGGGMEYLSSATTAPRMPFLYTSLRLARFALLSTEYTHGVRLKSQFTSQLRSRGQVELSYLRFAKGQRAIVTNNLEERMAAFSLPLQRRRTFLLSKFAVRQVLLPSIGHDSMAKVKYSDITKTKHTRAELTVSSSFSCFNAHLTTSGLLYDKSRSAYTNFALGCRLRYGFSIRSQMQLGHTQRDFSSAKLEMEKQLPNQGLLNFSLAKDFQVQQLTINIGLRYNFAFLKAALAVVRSNSSTTFIQSAGGSLLYEAPSRNVSHSRQRYLGRANLAVSPFLDLNSNGKRDSGEPGIGGLKIQINGGRILSAKGDTMIRITDLEPYTTYLLELDEKSLGNISWQIKNKRVGVVAEPNVFKRVDIPVTIAGEAAGTVHFKDETSKRGTSGILVNFYDSRERLVGQTESDSDGYFSYLGLVPGKYTARIDAVQLNKLNLYAQTTALIFQISPSEEGVVVEGLEFILRRQ